jgi:hypothetical protein
MARVLDEDLPVTFPLAMAWEDEDETERERGRSKVTGY